MLLLPKSRKLRALRFAAPALTFPLGAAAEAAAAALAAASPTPHPVVLWLLTLVPPTNLVGGLLAYIGLPPRTGVAARAMGALRAAAGKPEGRRKDEQGVLFPKGADGRRSSIKGALPPPPPM